MKPYSIKDFHIGDKVVLADAGCRSWNYKNITLREAFVVKVGRSVVTINAIPTRNDGQKYKINPHTGYGLVDSAFHSDNMIFKSIQDYEDYLDYLSLRELLNKEIRNLNTLDLAEDKIRRILDIILEKE